MSRPERPHSAASGMLPTNDQVLEAMAGNVRDFHPVLVAACELAEWHGLRARATSTADHEIDCARAMLVRNIDRWVAGEVPRPHGGATMHSETLGMVVDRLARFSVDAYGVLAHGAPAGELHFAWKRLAELTIAYGDLAGAVAARDRRLPDLSAAGLDRGGR
ncbi:hypothetical protein NONO_c58270 [Nocardia nova SH22a]|uniref:DUF4254 domain-containing protein n=2 Tax=Nocardia nova TaxID=37330 RepID=W5TN90_9NOCA|nr:hypothetical protein NONO_c58270 [Nocardia nova SH22a]